MTTIAISLPEEQVVELRRRAQVEDRPLSRVVGALIAAGIVSLAASASRPPAPKRARRGKG
jgi:hypothetical protein